MLNARFALLSLAGAFALFAGMLIFMELGRRYGLKQSHEHGAASRAGVGTVDSAVFSLLALLIGFAFSGAAGRFDKRREMVADQVNAASTLWDRIETLAPAQQPLIRDDVRKYVDRLLHVYDHPAGSREEKKARQSLEVAKGNLWSHVTGYVLTPEGEKARMLVVPATNELFDAVDTERMAQRIHPPTLIYAMIVLTALAGALFAGYGLATTPHRNWMLMIGAAATVSIAVFVTMELESARVGWIRIDAMNEVLQELRAELR
jgi:hypothetical protein